jgi:hypothetical protein
MNEEGEGVDPLRVDHRRRVGRIKWEVNLGALDYFDYVRSRYSLCSRFHGRVGVFRSPKKLSDK